MSHNKPEISLQSMYERLAATYDQLATGSVNPEVADRQIKAAETFTRFADLELKAMALAWSHDREITPGPVMGNLVEPEHMVSANLPLKGLPRGRR